MVLSMSNTNQPHLPQRITVTMKFNFNSIFYVRYKSEEISPYVGRKADWVLKFSCFFGFQESRGIGYSRYCVFKNFSRILEKFHFSISISKHFQFTFHSRFQGILISFSKRVNHIFISLLTSQKELIIFSFHFSLLGKK